MFLDNIVSLVAGFLGNVSERNRNQNARHPKGRLAYLNSQIVLM
jgi:hypothetical protein